MRGGGGASRPAGTCVLPDGSCTELPRGPSLCPARISSVPGASGWESAGSRKHAAPAPVHAHWAAVTYTRRAWLWARGQQARFLHLAKKKKTKTAGPLSPKPPEVLTLGFPQHLERGKKKSGPYSHRIKLDLTSQQLKEVTTLTPTLPASQRAAGLEQWLWSALEIIQRCKYFYKAERKAEDTLGPYFS